MEDFLSRLLREAQMKSQPNEGELYFDSVQDQVAVDPNAIPVPRIQKTSSFGDTMVAGKMEEGDSLLITTPLAEQQRINALADKQRQLDFLRTKGQEPQSFLNRISSLDNMLGNVPTKVEQGVKIESAPGPASTGLPQQPSKFAKQVATVQSELDDIDQFEKERMAEEEDATGDEPVQAQAVSDPYADAVEDARRDKLMLALGRAGETIGRSMAGGGVVTAEKGDGLKALEPLVGDQLAALTDKQKLEFDKSKLVVAQLQQQNAETAADPNSQASTLGRTIFANALKNIGMAQEAVDILKNKPSLNQLEAAYGQYSLANAESREEAERARLAQLALTQAAKADSKASQMELRQNDWLDKSYERINKSDEMKEYKNIETSVLKIRTALETADATGDIAALYNFMKALDRDSAVREAELTLAQTGMGKLAELRTGITRYLSTKPRILDDRYKKMMMDYMEALRVPSYNRLQPIVQREKDAALARGIPEDRLNLIDVVKSPETPGKTESKKTTKKPSWAK